MARKESGSKTFESALGDLQQVVEQLETGELSLEDSLDAFEKGVGHKEGKLRLKPFEDLPDEKDDDE